MRTLLGLFIFLLIILSVEIYAFYGLRTYWNKKKNWRRQTIKYLYFILFGLSFLFILILFFNGKDIQTSSRNFLIALILINFMSKFFLSIFLAMDDLRRLVLKIKNEFQKKNTQAEKNGITRSDFLAKVGIVAAALPISTLSFGMIYGPYRYTLHSQKIKLPKLPKAFAGLKIVQISDIHVGSFYDKKSVKKGIQMILDLKPDVIFFTGDIVNDTATEMDNYYEVFEQVKAPMGVYSILGNHDYGDYRAWSSEEEKLNNFEDVKKIHQKLGWTLLLNEHIYLERGDEKIGVIGVENWGKGFHQFGDLEKAYQNCEADVKILLSHDPTHFDEQVITNFTDIDLTLSGHTHGAQFGIETHGFKWSPVQLRYEKWAGLYQLNNQYLYINRGFGFLAYPGRLGIWPEITLIELE